MKRVLFFCLLATALASAQKQRVAVLPSVGELEPQRLNLLTDKVREIASKTLPPNNFTLLKQDAVMRDIGEEDYFVACKEGTCIGELAKKANANYGARCDVFRVDSNLVLKFELYSVKDEAILETFTDYNAKDFYRMLDVLEERLPGAFRKMIPGGRGVPVFPVGISGMEKAVDYELDYGGRRYLVHINTEPSDAVLSFNGEPIASCSKTPCKAELPEGSIRIAAALEHYERADTTVSIMQNNQSINIRLKPNFGVLEIKPAYIDGIGTDRQWNLSINDKPYSFGEIRLYPNKYAVKLGHECYENIAFEVGINKDKREVFNMAGNIALKKGGLDLSAEADGEPVSEPVYVNGKRVGETPFSGSVPVCAKVEIGPGREAVNVRIEHNIKKSYKHQMSTEELKRRVRLAEVEKQRAGEKARQYAEIVRKRAKNAGSSEGIKMAEEAMKMAEAGQTAEAWKKAEEANKKAGEANKKAEEEKRTAWHWSQAYGTGLLVMMNSIDTNYSTLGWQALSISLEYFKPSIPLRFGLNLDFGLMGYDENALKRINPEVDIDSTIGGMSLFIKGGAFMRLYPTDAFYLSGGASYGIYGGCSGKTATGEIARIDGTSTVVFPVGAGLVSYVGFIEALYNIALLKNGTSGYLSFTIGGKFPP